MFSSLAFKVFHDLTLPSSQLNSFFFSIQCFCSRYASASFLYVWNSPMIVALFQFCEILSLLKVQLKYHLLHEAFPKHLSLKVLAAVWVRRFPEWDRLAWLNQLTTGRGITLAGSHQYWFDYLVKCMHLSQGCTDKKGHDWHKEARSLFYIQNFSGRYKKQMKFCHKKGTFMVE